MARGDYWPDGERFGVMVVSGYSDAAASVDSRARGHASHAFVFYVVDLHREAEVIQQFVGRGKELTSDRVLKARGRARRMVDKLNRAEQRAIAAAS